MSHPDDCNRCGASRRIGPYQSPACEDCGNPYPMKRTAWPRVIFGAIGFVLIIAVLTGNSTPTWKSAVMILSAFAFLCLAFLPRED